MLADALERTASADRAKLRDALAATDMPAGPTMILPTARLRFGPDGQNPSAPLFVVQFQNSVLLPVWPADYAGAKVNLPR